MPAVLKATHSRRSGEEDRPPQPERLLPDGRSRTGTAAVRMLRQIQFPERTLTYELQRSDRRTIGFLIDGRGLRVTAPRAASIERIESALADKSRWIARKLAEWDTRRERLERQAIRWEDGAAIPLFGRPLVLRLDPRLRGIAQQDDRLIVGAPTQTAPEQLKTRIQPWLRARARETFAGRLDWFARHHGLAPRRWTLSSARMRWGSCSADGSIRLNWRLVHFPPEIIDYVITHELVHLREFNHSRRFWQLVGQICPEYQHARAWLRDAAAEAVR